MIYRPDYMDALKAFKDKPLVKILTGVRRCGKSTIFKMFKEELIRSYYRETVYGYGYTGEYNCKTDV